MKVTFLGTGCAMVIKRFNTCFLLEDGDNKLLVDAGGGNEVLRRLDQLGVSIRQIGGMYVTHSHTDHILGTPWIIRAVGTEIAEQGYEGTFTIVANKKTLEQVRTISEMILGKKMTKYFDKQILFREVEDGEKINLAGFDLTAFDICSTKMVQFGFQLELGNGEQVCFPGDEPLQDSVKHYAKDVKWLFSEAYCLYKDREQYQPYKRNHVTSLDCAQMAQELGAKNLVIYHTEDYGDDRKEIFTAEARTAYTGNIYVPEDMESIEL